MPFQQFSGLKKWAGILLYHLGRISVYAALGLTLHSFTSIFTPQWQQYISIVLGSLLLVVGLVSFFSKDKWRINLPWSQAVKNALGRFIGNPKLYSLFLSGALNGLLPCGLVYMALSMTVATPTALQSMLLMYVFGIGTMPVLIAITVLKDKASFLRVPAARKFVPVIMFAFGCLFVVRGMNLGIPYLSPEISVENKVVKAKCCHK
jgi:sulfite exporter TauE/SafE